MRKLALTICLCMVPRLLMAAPFPLPETAISLQQQQLRRQFGQREIVDAYNSDGNKDPRWDELCKKLLEGFVDRWAMPHTAATPVELLELAQQAVDAGCADPMVLYARGCLLLDVDMHYEAAHALRVAVEGFPESSYDVSFHCWAALRLAEAIVVAGPDKEAAPYLEIVRTLLPQVVAEADYRSREQRVLFHQITDDLLRNPSWQQAQQYWDVLREAKMQPWLKECLHAVYELRDADEFRKGLIGTAYLKRENVERWTRNYEAAASHGLKAWELDKSVPEGANLMFAATRLQGGSMDEVRQWFDRCVAADFDYLSPYTQLRFVMQNDPGVSHKEMVDQGREFLATGRFDTTVPFFLLQFVAPTIPRVDQEYPPLLAPGAYEDLVTMAEGYLAEPKSEWTHSWMQSFLIALAWRCERWNDGARRLAEHSGEFDPDAFFRLGVDMNEGVGEILARSGDWSEEIASALRETSNGEYAGAATIYSRVRDESKDVRVKAYAARRARFIGRQRDFHAGKSVSLLPNGGLRGWLASYGTWSESEGHTIVGESSKSGLLLIGTESFGVHYVLEGQVRFVRSHFAGNNVGVYFGAPTGRYSLKFPYRPPTAFRIYEDKDYATLDLRRAEQKQQLQVPEIVDFRVERAGDKVTTYVGDQRIHDSVPLGLGLDPKQERLGIGGQYWYPDTVIEFTKLSIRKLEPPVESAANLTE